MRLERSPSIEPASGALGRDPGKETLEMLRMMLGMFLCSLSLGFGSIAQAQQPVEASALGGPGESCRARSDCEANLRCVANVCHHPDEGTSCSAVSDCAAGLTCRANACVSAISASMPSTVPTARPRREPMDLDGIRLFGGVTAGLGPSYVDGSGANGAFAFELELGAFFNRAQIALHLSPVTSIYALHKDVEPNLSAVLAGAYYFRLGRSLDYVVRTGFGVLALNTRVPLMEMRIDPLTLAYRLPRVILEASFPSVRVNFDVDPKCSGPCTPLVPSAAFLATFTVRIVSDDMR